MKKLFALILALTLALTVTALATEIDADEGETLIKYTVASSYTITIPDGVTITGTGTGIGTGTGEFAVGAGTLIDAAKVLKFTITNAVNYDTGFRLVNGSDVTVFLTYEIKDEADDLVELNDPFFVVNAADCYAGDSITLTYTTATVEAAGEYTDTITITVTEVAP